jgi:spore germination cell wall hydrolase CwlJ-like protein
MDLVDLVSQEEKYCMTEAIYHEARGDGYHSQLIVGFLILRRVENEWYPNTICDVVYQPNQFSYTSDANSLSMFETEAKEFAKDVTYIVLTTPNPLPENALLYHNDTIETPASWDEDLIELYAQVGSHVIYEEFR